MCIHSCCVKGIAKRYLFFRSIYTVLQFRAANAMAKYVKLRETRVRGLSLPWIGIFVGDGSFQSDDGESKCNIRRDCEKVNCSSFMVKQNDCCRRMEEWSPLFSKEC